VDTRAEFPGGGHGTGVSGLIDYIRSRRENDYVDTLCRKVLAYGLGRSLQLSDEPLLEQTRTSFVSAGHRFSSLIESIVVSPQFLNQRSPELGIKKGG
jgi:hypothetical protein